MWLCCAGRGVCPPGARSGARHGHASADMASLCGAWRPPSSATMALTWHCCAGRGVGHAGAQPALHGRYAGANVASLSRARRRPPCISMELTWRCRAERGVGHPGAQPEVHHRHAGADVARAPHPRGAHSIPPQAQLLHRVPVRGHAGALCQLCARAVRSGKLPTRVCRSRSCAPAWLRRAGLAPLGKLPTSVRCVLAGGERPAQAGSDCAALSLLCVLSSCGPVVHALLLLLGAAPHLLVHRRQRAGEPEQRLPAARTALMPSPWQDRHRPSTRLNLARQAGSQLCRTQTSA